jgi:hypothetical protein
MVPLRNRRMNEESRGGPLEPRGGIRPPLRHQMVPLRNHRMNEKSRGGPLEPRGGAQATSLHQMVPLRNHPLIEKPRALLRASPACGVPGLTGPCRG